MEPGRRRLIIIAIIVGVAAGAFVGISVAYVYVSDANVDRLDVMQAIYSTAMDSGKLFDSAARGVTGGVEQTGTILQDVSEDTGATFTELQDDIDAVKMEYDERTGAGTPDETADTDDNTDAGDMSGGGDTSVRQPPADEAVLDRANTHEPAPIPDDVMDALEQRRLEIQAAKEQREADMAGADAEDRQRMQVQGQPSMPSFTHRTFAESEYEYFGKGAISGTIKRVESTNTIFISGQSGSADIYLQLAGVPLLQVDDERYPYAMEFIRAKCPSGHTVVYEGSVTSAKVWCYGYGKEPPHITMNTLLREYGYVG